ncbi:MAG: aminotransferase class V-fold PLP-dependent enzyme [Peptococcaceae bacterium]|nr:aminotransferase class V-fold PLP-dependent enzyme [Peptococcaceae bacterium]
MEDSWQKQNDAVRALMHDFVDRVVDMYSTMDARPVSKVPSAETLARAAAQEIPADGRALADVYEEMREEIYAHTILAQHPRFFACVPSTASLLSWMGEAMTAAYNPHASCQINAPVADLIEKKLVRWLCDAAGYPEGAGGLFVSGGSMANLTALVAARDAKLSADARGRAVVYLSDQTHSSVAKALTIIGFGKEQVRLVATDADFRMDMGALAAAVAADKAAGRKPFAVVASAGTTNTGSVDPLEAIADLCAKEDMWLHVDGAFGASVLLSTSHRARLSGIERADSLSWDAHKWLLQTFGCGIVLVRNCQTLINSFVAHPEYLKDVENDEDGIEFWDLGPELTRPARALKLWLTLQTMGTDAVGRAIDHGFALAEAAESLLAARDGWEIVSHAQLGVVNFRYVGDGTLDEDALALINARISQDVSADGFAMVFTTELRGKKVLRLCTIHPETTFEDVRRTVDKILDAQAHVTTKK